MDSSVESKGSRNGNHRLRNYDLTVDEIRLMRSIDEMTKSIDKIKQLDPQSSRAKIVLKEIGKLEEKLEELRDNTLIKWSLI